MWTPEQDRQADEVADAIVAIATQRHPGDPAAIALCAIALTETALADAAPIRSTEDPKMTPAELELRLSSPGRKWDRQPWQPRLA
jgi:hypothetical protein